MRFVTHDIGVRMTVRGYAALRLPSRVVVLLLSLLFLLSAQLCYSMAHDMPSMQSALDCHMSEPQTKTPKPMEHGAKAPNMCVMMACGGIVQLADEFNTSVPMQDFGLPPLAAALGGRDPHGVLRPPIVLQA